MLTVHRHIIPISSDARKHHGFQIVGETYMQILGIKLTLLICLLWYIMERKINLTSTPIRWFTFLLE